MPPTNAARLAAAVAGRGMTKASRGMREGTPDPIGMWQDATTLFGEEKYREAEAGWHTLAKLLAPDAVDAAFNYALCLERQDRYFEATMVWEKILMANRDAYERAQTHVETLVSLMARDLGVLSAGAMHPDPEVESRRRKERKRAGLRNDGGGKAGGKGGGKGGAFGTPLPPPIPTPPTSHRVSPWLRPDCGCVGCRRGDIRRIPGGEPERDAPLQGRPGGSDGRG